MSGPTGMIFAMRAKYDGPDGPNEAFFDEADPTFSNGANTFEGGTRYQEHRLNGEGQFVPKDPRGPGYDFYDKTGGTEYIPANGWNAPFDHDGNRLLPEQDTSNMPGGQCPPDAANPQDPRYINHPYVPGETPRMSDMSSSNPGLLDDACSPGGYRNDPNMDGSYGNEGGGRPSGGYNGDPDPSYDPRLNQMQGMGRAQMERLGEPGNEFRQMGFSIEKAVVEARGRALKAQYSMELAQDLRAIHGLDAEAELANILSSEILAEINREVVRTVYRTAIPGAQNNVNTPGIFDLDLDSNGRWSVEKFKGLLFQIERDANAIAQLTRRGKGNMIICSADVASALTMAGVLDYTPALNANLSVDDTGNLFAGTINGKMKVYIDPYSANISNTHYYVVGYKGTSAYDAGLFYCPYVPLQMVRSVTDQTFQPNIGFKTRYGLIANPFAEGPSGPYNQGLGRLADNTNRYYRRVRIDNLM